jgi:hypothetical protein
MADETIRADLQVGANTSEAEAAVERLGKKLRATLKAANTEAGSAGQGGGKKGGGNGGGGSASSAQDEPPRRRRPTSPFQQSRMGAFSRRAEFTAQRKQVARAKNRLPDDDVVQQALQGSFDLLTQKVNEADRELRELGRQRAIEIIDAQVKQLGDSFEDTNRKAALLGQRRVLEVASEVERGQEEERGITRDIAALPADTSRAKQIELETKLQETQAKNQLRLNELYKAGLTGNANLARTNAQFAAQEKADTEARIAEQKRLNEAIADGLRVTDLRSEENRELADVFKELDVAIARNQKLIQEASQQRARLLARLQTSVDPTEVRRLNSEYEALGEQIEQVTRELSELQEVRDLAETTAAEASVPQLRESQAATRSFAQIDQGFNAFSETASSLSELGVIDGVVADTLDLVGSYAELNKVLPRMGAALSFLSIEVTKNTGNWLVNSKVLRGATAGMSAANIAILKLSVATGALVIAGVGLFIAFQKLTEMTAKFREAAEKTASIVQARFDLVEELFASEEAVGSREIQSRIEQTRTRLALLEDERRALLLYKEATGKITDSFGVSAALGDTFAVYDDAVKELNTEIGIATAQVETLEDVLARGAGRINDLKISLEGLLEQSGSLAERLEESNAEIASLREQASGIETSMANLADEFQRSEAQLRATAAQEAAFTAQMAALDEQFRTTNEELQRRFELEDRAAEQSERIGQALGNLVNGGSFSALEGAATLFTNSASLVEELGTQTEGVFRALNERGIEVGGTFGDVLDNIFQISSATDKAIGAALADLSEGIRSALGSEIVNALETEGQRIGDILREQNSALADNEAKKRELLEKTQQDELDRLAKFLLERARALEDYNLRVRRLEEDFARERFEAIRDNDIRAFLDSQTNRRVTLQREAEDFGIDDRRAREDFALEGNKGAQNVRDRIKALDDERVKIQQAAAERIALVQQETDAQIAKLVERYAREEERIQKQIELEEKRAAIFAEIAANEEQSRKALEAFQNGVRETAAFNERLSAYQKQLLSYQQELDKVNGQIFRATAENFLLSIAFNALTNVAIPNTRTAIANLSATMNESGLLLESVMQKTNKALNDLKIGSLALNGTGTPTFTANPNRQYDVFNDPLGIDPLGVNSLVGVAPGINPFTSTSPNFPTGGIPATPIPFPIPQFANGGIIPKGKSGLGYFEGLEPELVLPLSKAPAILGGAGAGQSVNVTVNLSIGDVKVGEVVSAAQARQTAQEVAEGAKDEIIGIIEEALTRGRRGSTS